MTDELDTNIIWGGGQPQKPIPFPKSQNGFFSGLNLKNDIIILILHWITIY